MDSVIVPLVIAVLFEVFARPLSGLFGLTGGGTAQIIETCATALRIAGIGYAFMGFSVAVQGILQSLRYALRPLFIAALRLVVFVFPIAFFFTLSENVVSLVWWTFPIAEILTAAVAAVLLRKSYRERVEKI